MGSTEKAARAFTEDFYSAYDTDRKGLGAFYSSTSLLTFDGTQIQGPAKIADKLQSLASHKVEHSIPQADFQFVADGSVVAMVIGALKVDDSPKVQRFSQSLLLIPNGESYLIQYDIFKLVYHA